jgi:hypothetical protein
MRLLKWGSLNNRGFCGIMLLVVEIFNPFRFRKTGYFRILQLAGVKITVVVSRPKEKP